MSNERKLQSGNTAPNIQVLNADGNTLELAALWQDKPVVLTFLRHFG